MWQCAGAGFVKHLDSRHTLQGFIDPAHAGFLQLLVANHRTAARVGANLRVGGAAQHIAFDHHGAQGYRLSRRWRGEGIGLGVLRDDKKRLLVALLHVEAMFIEQSVQGFFSGIAPFERRGGAVADHVAGENDLHAGLLGQRIQRLPQVAARQVDVEGVLVLGIGREGEQKAGGEYRQRQILTRRQALFHGRGS